MRLMDHLHNSAPLFERTLVLQGQSWPDRIEAITKAARALSPLKQPARPTETALLFEDISYLTAILFFSALREECFSLL